MSKGLITTLVVIGVIVVFVGGFFMWGTGVYDNAISRQENVNEAFSNVQASYQRRADLIPSLVATVKGAAENEKGILVQVTEARAGIVGAKTPEDFADLQSQLEGTENRINVARQRYNETINGYNTYVRGFFKRMALNMFGGGEDFSVRKGFEAAAGSEKAPEVKF